MSVIAAAPPPSSQGAAAGGIGLGHPLDLLARFTAETTHADLPQDIAAKAKVHILDTLGAALAGTRSAEFHIVRDLLPAAEGAAPGASAAVWGTARRAGPRDAALVNGVAAHAFELDDTGGCDHSGAVVVPAVLAALPLAPRPVSGRALIAATVVGYDAGRRLLEAAGGYDAHNSAGWHSTGTCGPVAAAAAVANLWGLSPDQCRDAIALATSASAGLWAFIHDGSQAKKIHAGRAAEGGLLAASLAARGMSGPARVFDAVWGGFFRSFNHADGDASALSADLGRVWKIGRVSLKPYACCRGTHSAVDGVGDILGETGRSAADVASVRIRLSALLMGMCGGKTPATLAGAQMSLPYAVAVRLLDGDAGLPAFAADRRNDPRVAALIGRIDLEVDGTMRPLDEPEVTLCFADGARLSRVVPRATGSPERPMADDAVAAKFATLAAMALPEDAVERLSGLVAGLDGLEDCRRLDAALTVPADRPEQPVFV